jgi:hypothetical protein
VTDKVRRVARPTARFENLSEFVEAPTTAISPVQHDDVFAHALLTIPIAPR